jgi:lipoprotein-anchoring transpeptidase ErfK/SrfK
MTRTVSTAVQRTYILTLAMALVPVLALGQKAKLGGEEADPNRGLARQVALDRAGFSPGEIDGREGPKTRAALAEFQKHAGTAGASLNLPAQPIVDYTITAQDVAGPFIDQMPRDMMDSAKLPALGYTSPLEALAERFHSSPKFLQTLNPSAGWAAGDIIKVPDVEPFEPPSPKDKPAAKATTGAKPAPALEIIISGATKSLSVRDTAGRVLMYAPITVGSTRDPLPVGEWKVLSVSWNPSFNYNPDLFWDADPTHAKAKIPPGPNNPVGVVWIDINKEHFGLHGTPEPSTIGRTESHGCIRLSNWDATKLGRIASPGTKVTIQ